MPALSHPITILSVPSDIGSLIKGKSLAPAAFHSSDLPQKLADAGYSVHSTTALPEGPQTWTLDNSSEPNGLRNEEANAKVCHQVKDAVLDALRSGEDAASPPFILILGGECGIAPAIMSALSQYHKPKRIGLVYIDGDADLTIPGEEGSAGTHASMTMTHLTMREGALESMRPFTRPDGSGVVDPTNIVLFGLNAQLQGNTRSQMGYLFDEGFRVITSSAVAKDSVGRARQALEWLEERVDCIQILLDVDAIDGTRFPLANIPNRTGAGFDEVMGAVKVFLRSRKICGLVVTEVNPDHDPGLRMVGMLVDSLVESLRLRLEYL